MNYCNSTRVYWTNAVVIRVRALLRSDRDTGRDGRLPFQSPVKPSAQSVVMGEGVTGLDLAGMGGKGGGSVVSSSDAASAKCFVMSDARRDAIDGAGSSGVGELRRVVVVVLAERAETKPGFPVPSFLKSGADHVQ